MSFNYDMLLFQNIFSYFNQINSNLAAQKIEIESEFSSVIKVYRTGNVVSVDIDGNINAAKNVVFARNLPVAIIAPWVSDIMGRNYCVYYPGDISCTEDLNGWVNLHFTYLISQN